MEANRKFWNEQHKALHQALKHPDDYQKAVDLFLSVHAMVHSAVMSNAGLLSFEDEIFEGSTDEIIRRIPPKGEHSIAWVIWHIARIEDITMNLLVAGTPQVMTQDSWLEQMNIAVSHSGNVMDEQSIVRLSNTMDIEAMRAYRAAVGRRTREIVQHLRPEVLKQKVESSHIQQVWAEGAMIEAATGIVDYWSKRTIAGLLLMPPTRHTFLHLNEARRIKQQLKRQQK